MWSIIKLLRHPAICSDIQKTINLLFVIDLKPQLKVLLFFMATDEYFEKLPNIAGVRGSFFVCYNRPIEKIASSNIPQLINQILNCHPLNNKSLYDYSVFMVWWHSDMHCPTLQNVTFWRATRCGWWIFDKKFKKMPKITISWCKMYKPGNSDWNQISVLPDDSITRHEHFLSNIGDFWQTTSGSSPKCDFLEGWAVHVWTVLPVGLIWMYVAVV